jgi:hypothetical protein
VQVEAVVEAGEVPAGDLLDAADAVVDGVDVQMEGVGGACP